MTAGTGWQGVTRHTARTHAAGSPVGVSERPSSPLSSPLLSVDSPSPSPLTLTSAVKIDPLKLTGPWADGHMLERQHTISSEFIGYDSNGHAQFDTKRSELGELVVRLTNRSDRATLDPIADTAAEFVLASGIQFDAVVPVPPSRRRAFQPVIEIANALGARLAKPVLLNVVSKVKDTPEPRRPLSRRSSWERERLRCISWP